MEKWIIYDYYIQLSFLLLAIIAAITGVFLGTGFILFYFVGIPQLISFLIKLFSNVEKSINYIIYGIGIMPVWISFLVVLVFNDNSNITNIFGIIIISSLIYSPILAVLYTYDAYKLYQPLKYTK